MKAARESRGFRGGGCAVVGAGLDQPIIQSFRQVGYFQHLAIGAAERLLRAFSHTSRSADRGQGLLEGVAC